MNGDLNKPIATPTPPPQKKKNNFVVIFILLLLIGGFLTLIMLLRPKESTKQPSKPPVTSLSDTTLIATVDNKELFLGDVKNIAREQYTEAAIDNAALKTSLDIIIERRLLDREAKNRTVTITDQELQEALANTPSQLATSKRYELLREKLTPLLVQSRKAYTVGFWIAPENYQGAAVSKENMLLMEQQRRDALPALTQIKNQLESGKDALTAAKNVSGQYPSLEKIMAVNGYYLSRSEDETLLTTPRTYTRLQSDKQSAALFETIFRLQPGQIAIARDLADSAGGFVVKLVDISDNPYDTYDAWLSAQKEKLVVIHYTL